MRLCLLYAHARDERVCWGGERIPRSLARYVCACGLICSLVGCASSKPGSAAPRPLTRPITHAAATPNAPLAEPSAAHPTAPLSRATPIDAGKLTITAARTLLYDSEDGSRITVLQDALPDCHCAGRSWWVKYSKGGPGTLPEREVRMTIDASGYIAEAEEINRAEKIEIVFTPPLVVIPDKLPIQTSGNAGYQQDVKMVVHPLGNRSKVRTSGMAHSEIHYLGDESITTAAGEFTARKLHSTLTADLSAATSVNTTEQWWTDGVGLVFQRDHEVTKTFGIKVRENSSTIMLNSITRPG